MIKAMKYLILILIIPALIQGCTNDKSQENYTIGIINLNGNLDRVINEFKREMTQYGYNEDANTTYIYNGPLKKPLHIDAEILAMLDADADLLLTLTTPVTKRAKALTQKSHTPVLFAPVFSPVTTGIVESIASPGGHVTGIKTRGSTAKTLEWFLKAVPTAKRIFVPLHSNDKASLATVKDLQEAASFFYIELVIQNISNKAELNTALAHVPADIDAIWLTHSHLIISNIKAIVTAATLLQKPTISSADQSTAGVMLCYGMDHDKIGKQASRMADKILRGTSPAAIPVESADYFLGINLKTAQAVDIEIPDDIISQATYVTR